MISQPYYNRQELTLGLNLPPRYGKKDTTQSTSTLKTDPEVE